MTTSAVREPASSQQPHANPFITWKGRRVPRGKGFLKKGERVRCPENHNVSETARLLEDGTLYCDHRLGPGQPVCGAILYVCVLPARGGRRRLYVSDCTREELAEIERYGLDADGVLEYFGATFTR